MTAAQASAQAKLDLLVAFSLASLLSEGRAHLYALLALLHEYAYELWQDEPAATQALLASPQSLLGRPCISP